MSANFHKKCLCAQHVISFLSCISAQKCMEIRDASAKKQPQPKTSISFHP